MKKTLASLLLICFLSACAGQEKSPVYPPTFVPSPTSIPTPTVISISAINLDYVLIPPFILPEGTLPDHQVAHKASTVFDYLPPAQNTASVNLYHGSSLDGDVTVFLYANEDTRTRAYQMIVDEMGADVQNVEGVGEQAAVKKSMIFKIELVFRRCISIAVIDLHENIDLDTITSNAQFLDGQLQPLVCRQ